MDNSVVVHPDSYKVGVNLISQQVENLKEMSGVVYQWGEENVWSTSLDGVSHIATAAPETVGGAIAGLSWFDVSGLVMTASAAHMLYKVTASAWFQSEYQRLQEYLIQKDAVEGAIIGGIEIPRPRAEDDDVDFTVGRVAVVLPRDGPQPEVGLSPPQDEFYDIAREEAASCRVHADRNSKDGPWGSDQWCLFEYLERLDTDILNMDHREKSPLGELFSSVCSRSFLRRIVRYLGGCSEKRHAREKMNKKLKIALDMRAFVFRKITRQCLRGTDGRPDFSPENKELVERTLSPYVAKHFKQPGQEEGYVQLATALCFMDTSDDFLVQGLHDELIAMRPGRFF